MELSGVRVQKTRHTNSRHAIKLAIDNASVMNTYLVLALYWMILMEETVDSDPRMAVSETKATWGETDK